jgi:hypothetical protein
VSWWLTVINTLAYYDMELITALITVQNVLAKEANKIILYQLTLLFTHSMGVLVTNIIDENP